VPLDGLRVKALAAHGLANARAVMERLKAGRMYRRRGGQPLPTDTAARQSRIDGLYRVDAAMPVRKSHENPQLTKLYADFLGKPLSEVSHTLLHTCYTARK